MEGPVALQVNQAEKNKPTRIVVAGRVPPPVGGQNLNIARVLEILHSIDGIEEVYWEWGFTRDWSDHRRFGLRKAGSFVAAVVRLAQLRRKGPFAAILFSTGGPSRMGVIRDIVLIPLARLFCPRIIIYFQAAGIREYLPKMSGFLRACYRGVHRFADGAVVITPYGRSDPVALGIRDVAVLPYGIEDRFDENGSSESDPSDSNPPVLLSVGHLCPDKGTPQLIAAFSRVREAGWNVRLRLVGECLAPYDADTLANDIAASGMREHIDVDGLLEGDGLWHAYGSSDLFVFASVAPYESFGLVLLEAMMMGMPAVVSDWRANADVLGRDSPPGGVITSADVGERLEDRLYEGIVQALRQRDSWAAWGARNRRRFLAEYSMQAYANRLGSYFGRFR
jgi:glycosyltransferase involved in cell wall biosynthesis